MSSRVNRIPHDYRVAALALTVALSELANAVNTQEFGRAFWEVQKASEECKRARLGVPPAPNKKSNNYQKGNSYQSGPILEKTA
jgi:hypothetical protein